MKNKLHKIKIVDVVKETDACSTYLFEATPALDYKPGQFLTFLFERHGKEIRRSYSFSSSPDSDEMPSITIKQTPNGEISRWWLKHVKSGSEMKALPPAGMFTLTTQERPRTIFLTAAGSGITPLFSILKSLLVKEPHTQVTLIYSNRSKSTTIFYRQLLALQASYPQQLEIVWFFSDDKNLLTARLSTFNLQRILNDRLNVAAAEAVMYTCGPYYYMQMVQITCLTMGFRKENFRKELFDINVVPSKIKKYFDTTDRDVTIEFNGQSFIIPVPYEETILQAALNVGIELPYNCRAGKCSTCVCKVVSGKVWMHYNEVLTEDDEAKGLALTCTGHPASDQVIIDL